MTFPGHLHHDPPLVVPPIAPTIVAGGGYVYLNPLLSGPRGLRVREAGYDPSCALISELG